MAVQQRVSRRGGDPAKPRRQLREAATAIRGSYGGDSGKPGWRFGDAGVGAPGGLSMSASSTRLSEMHTMLTTGPSIRLLIWYPVSMPSIRIVMAIEPIRTRSPATITRDV